MNRLLFLPLIILFAAFSCKSTQNAADEKQSGPGWVEVTSGNFCGVEQSMNKLILNAAEWESIWGQITEGQMGASAAPKVDFNKYCLLACFMGSQNSGGYEIVVGPLRKKGELVKVTVTHVAPGEGCFTTAALSQPFIVVQVERQDIEKAEFTVQEETKDC